MELNDEKLLIVLKKIDRFIYDCGLDEDDENEIKGYITELEDIINK